MRERPWVIEESLPWGISYFFTMNTILGSGVLGMAWAYNELGWGLGIICQVLVALVGLALLNQLIQVMSWLEALKKTEESGQPIVPVTIRELFEYKSALDRAEDHSGESEALVSDRVDVEPEVTSRRFDLLNMAGILFGEKGAQVFGVCLSTQILPTLVGYTAIFGSSMAAFIPIFGETCNIYDEPGFDGSCRYIYMFYVLVYLAIMVVLVIIGLAEQVIFQVISSIIRFSVVLILLITSIAAIASKTYLEDDGENEVNSPEAFHFHNLGIGVQIIVGATFYHNTFPNTVQFAKDKHLHLRKIGWLTLLTGAIMFLLLGLILPLAIDDVEKLITLNWAEYSAGEDSSDREWWTYLISGIVVLMPAIEISSAFPLQSINLSDNWLSLRNPDYRDNVTNRFEYILFRLLASVPSILVGLFVYDLSLILDIVGLMNFIVSGVWIPMFWLAASRLATQRGIYDSAFSNKYWAYGLMLGNSIAFVVIAVLMLYEWTI